MWTLSGSLIWWKMFIASAQRNTEAWNPACLDLKTQPFHQRCVLVHCFAGRCKSQAISTSVRKWLFWAFLWLQWLNFNSLSLMNQMKSTFEAGHLFSKSVRTGCNKPVCTRGTLWRQHYITASKEYLTNRHILSKYFELEFFRLQLVKISCKLIIIEWNVKKRCLFMKHRVDTVVRVSLDQVGR